MVARFGGVAGLPDVVVCVAVPVVEEELAPEFGGVEHTFPKRIKI